MLDMVANHSRLVLPPNIIKMGLKSLEDISASITTRVDIIHIRTKVVSLTNNNSRLISRRKIATLKTSLLPRATSFQISTPVSIKEWTTGMVQLSR